MIYLACVSCCVCTLAALTRVVSCARPWNPVATRTSCCDRGFSATTEDHKWAVAHSFLPSALPIFFHTFHQVLLLLFYLYRQYKVRENIHAILNQSETKFYHKTYYLHNKTGHSVQNITKIHEQATVQPFSQLILKCVPPRVNLQHLKYVYPRRSKQCPVEKFSYKGYSPPKMHMQWHT